ncbi:hypothetical protein GJV26_00925 [Massilia dura]|uniref:DUF2924 domain-containing protein n=1 Tax=Pseudoduganella dura TaxID=321982 RepID=A0A6I3XC24_9BURK|nr:hypothetical protein [Pseudoduganella dura]MUI11061.1 hypothetical protein [Pseudoduganella dura]GGY03150.1 hypothetical protein GCM10007386_37560 [Pseudoduganella dura]
MECETKQAVYLPIVDFPELELHLLETRPGLKPDAFINDLIRHWLARDIERAVLRTNGPALRGFQWKTLFLPEGTILRTSHRDEVEFAKVSGHRIVSADDATLTPSSFANRHASGRNAWRFVWLRFPGNDCWVRADECRERAGNLPRKQSMQEAEPG